MSELGGYLDVTKSDGSLKSKHTRMPPQPFEVVVEMYGMIWYLANEVLHANPDYPAPKGDGLRRELLREIEEARKEYKQGLFISPT